MGSCENIEKSTILKAVDDRLVILHGVWMELGLDQTTQLAKNKTIHNLLIQLLDTMVEEEINAKEELLNRLEVNTKIAVCLSRDLEVNYEEPDNQLVLVKYEQAVRDEAIRLEAMKGQRLREVTELIGQDEELCKRLCVEPFYLSTSRVPNTQQVNGLTEHIAILEAEKERRFGQFLGLRKSINLMYEELECGPETAMEREIICEMADGFVLSSSNLSATHSILEKLEERRNLNVQRAAEAVNKLEYLYDLLGMDEGEKTEFLERTQGHSPSVIEELNLEVARLEGIRREKIEKLVLSKRAELHKMWDVCFYNQHQRSAFLPLNSCDFTEELLKQHDDELKRLENYYEKTKEVLTKVFQREQVWEKFKELERLEGDPSRLINARGNSLLLEEKERNKVNKALPRLETELREIIVSWEEQNGEEFLLVGLTFTQFLESQMEEHLMQLDADKRARELAKDAPNSDVKNASSLKHKSLSTSISLRGSTGSGEKRPKEITKDAPNSDVKNASTLKYKALSTSISSKGSTGSGEKRPKEMTKDAPNSDVQNASTSKYKALSTSISSRGSTGSGEKRPKELTKDASNSDVKNASTSKYKAPSTSVSSRGSSGSLSRTPGKIGSLTKAGRISKVSSPRTLKANRSKLRKGMMAEQLFTNVSSSNDYMDFKKGSRLNSTEISVD